MKIRDFLKSYFDKMTDEHKKILITAGLVAIALLLIHLLWILAPDVLGYLAIIGIAVWLLTPPYSVPATLDTSPCSILDSVHNANYEELARLIAHALKSLGNIGLNVKNPRDIIVEAEKQRVSSPGGIWMYTYVATYLQPINISAENLRNILNDMLKRQSAYGESIPYIYDIRIREYEVVFIATKCFSEEQRIELERTSPCNQKAACKEIDISDEDF